MSRDRAELRSWYRRAMVGRIAELQALREALREGDTAAFDAARAVGQALRGSGATFGFPEITAVATVLETSPDRDVLRRVEGLISELHVFTAEGGDTSVFFHAEWLLGAAGLPADSEELVGATDAADAWARVGRAAELDSQSLTSAVARYLGLAVADLERPTKSALSLVPEALMGAGRIVPLKEDSLTITVASAEPTSLHMELELRRVTGRAPVFAVAPPEAIAAALSNALDEPPPARERILSPVEEHELGDKTVLVVDDEASARLYVRSLLEKRGLEVVEAVDGVEALERMGEHPAIELVVADLNMPRLDGLELIWKLRSEQGWSHVPVIVVTGELDEILETQLIEEGADDYIRKPLDPRLFLARVEATIRRYED